MRVQLERYFCFMQLYFSLRESQELNEIHLTFLLSKIRYIELLKKNFFKYIDQLAKN